MKVILILFAIFAFSTPKHFGNEASTHNTSHTYLVKTDLTKEQVEALLHEHNQMEVQSETNEANQTTTLKKVKNQQPAAEAQVTQAQGVQAQPAQAQSVPTEATQAEPAQTEPAGETGVNEKEPKLSKQHKKEHKKCKKEGKKQQTGNLVNQTSTNTQPQQATTTVLEVTQAQATALKKTGQLPHTHNPEESEPVNQELTPTRQDKEIRKQEKRQHKQEARIAAYNEEKAARQARATNLKKKDELPEPPEEPEEVEAELSPKKQEKEIKKNTKKYDKEEKEYEEALNAQQTKTTSLKKIESPEPPENDDDDVKPKKLDKYKAKKQNKYEKEEAKYEEELNAQQAQKTSLKKHDHHDDDELPELPDAPEEVDDDQSPERQEKQRKKNKKKYDKEFDLYEKELAAYEARHHVSQEKTALLVKNTSTSSKILSYFTLLIFIIGFFSLLIYATQPKKVTKKYTNTIAELTDYLLVRDNNQKNKENINARDF